VSAKLHEHKHALMLQQLVATQPTSQLMLSVMLL
jgi:hypothetical protein